MPSGSFSESFQDLIDQIASQSARNQRDARPPEPMQQRQPVPWAAPQNMGQFSQQAYQMSGVPQYAASRGEPVFGLPGGHMQLPTPPVGPGISGLPMVNPTDIIRAAMGRRLGMGNFGGDQMGYLR